MVSPLTRTCSTLPRECPWSGFDTRSRNSETLEDRGEVRQVTQSRRRTIGATGDILVAMDGDPEAQRSVVDPPGPGLDQSRTLKRPCSTCNGAAVRLLLSPFPRQGSLTMSGLCDHCQTAVIGLDVLKFRSAPLPYPSTSNARLPRSRPGDGAHRRARCEEATAHERLQEYRTALITRHRDARPPARRGPRRRPRPVAPPQALGRRVARRRAGALGSSKELKSFGYARIGTRDNSAE